MIGMKKGLFGKGMMPGPMDSAMPAYSMPQDMGVQDANFGGGGGAMPAKGGGLKNVLLAALGGAADGASQFFGGQPLIAQNQQMQQIMAFRRAEEQRRRAAELADYRTKLSMQAEFATPEKDAFDRALVNAGIDPRSPQGVELYRQRAVTMAQGQPQEPRMVTLPDGRAIFGTMDEIRGVLGGGGAQQGAPSGGMPRVTNRQEYDAIPPGTQYTDPNGKVRTKGGTSGNVGGSFRP